MRKFIKLLFGIAVVIGIAAMMMVPTTAMAADYPLMGFLKINTNPFVPTIISVDGVRLDGWAVKKVPIMPGEHVISFTDLPGYVTPEPMTVLVMEGETTSVIARFVALASLHVISEPAVKTTISVDGIARDDWGAWIWVMPGTHNISFGKVCGYDPPPVQTVKVREGNTVTVKGMFTENVNATGPDMKYGELRVETVPSVPTTISVDGIARDTFGLAWLKLEPGTHTVSFSDVPDYATPEPIVVTVEEGMISSVSGAFTLEGGLRIVTTPPNSAVIYVDGVACDTWGVWLVLPEGRYTVSFGEIPGAAHDDTPMPRSVLVVAGQITLVIGTYS